MPKKLIDVPKLKALTYEQRRYAESTRHLWKKNNPGKRSKGSLKSAKLIDAILDMVAMGYPIDVSCATNDVYPIPYSTFNKWCFEDNELRRRLDSSLLAAEKMLVNPIMRGALNGNKADSQWLLRHRFPHKYHDRTDNPSQPPDVTDPTAALIKFITEGTGADPK